MAGASRCGGSHDARAEMDAGGAVARWLPEAAAAGGRSVGDPTIGGCCGPGALRPGSDSDGARLGSLGGDSGGQLKQRLLGGLIILRRRPFRGPRQAGHRVDAGTELQFEPLASHPGPGDVGLRLVDRAVAVEIPFAKQFLTGRPTGRAEGARHEAAAATGRRVGRDSGHRGAECHGEERHGEQALCGASVGSHGPAPGAGLVGGRF
jgi:hypothetical protein